MNSLMTRTLLTAMTIQRLSGTGAKLVDNLI